jgi:hypothetical protein
MTDTTNRNSDTLLTDIQLSVRDDATDADRQNAQRSVAALIARHAATVARERAAEADLAQLTGSLNRPFAKLIDEDPRASEALEKLGTQQLMQPEAMDALGQDAPSVLTFDTMPSAPHEGIGVRSQGFVPPYDFQWAWHDTNGHPPFNIVQDRASGRLGVDARSGQAPGGAPGFVNVHAGFGVFLRSDTTTQKFPHAVLNPGNFRFAVRAIGIGSNATSEGGFEITVFENGQFLTGASRKLWRSRVSGSITSPDESASGGQPNHLITGPEVQFTIHPGREYTFNAGIWAFSDRSTGIGAGAVQSLLQGTLTRMWVFG